MLRIIFALAFLGISLCVSQEYFIEVNPNNEPDYYEMRIGDIVTFEVSGYKKGQSGNSLVSLEGKIWWEYDKRLLEKVSSGESSIRLKAIKEGISQLSATTIIKNNHCQEEISISITK